MTYIQIALLWRCVSLLTGEGMSIRRVQHLWRPLTLTLHQNEWRKFVSPTCPGPRSAHAVVATPAGGGKLYLFGENLVLYLFSTVLTSQPLYTHRRRVLLIISKLIPPLSRLLVFRHLDAYVGAHRNEGSTNCAFGSSVSASVHIYIVCDGGNSKYGGRMAMWKHYIVLFGGFYDPGIKSQYITPLYIA